MGLEDEGTFIGGPKEEFIGTYTVLLTTPDDINPTIQREQHKGAEIEDIHIFYAGRHSEPYFLLEFYTEAPDIESLMTLQEAADMRGTLMHLKAKDLTIKEILAYLGEMKK